ncbi:hypothetical protein Bca52824_025646 [Brassica carinata]|uniref:Uncharacterized protein n=1 Tax=Brassica carinata TaxID=52824 RepID=A0A8X7SGK4_BRACI|nr:hypothetical protein Bca52824_025646 [Brassica carinata]
MKRLMILLFLQKSVIHRSIPAIDEIMKNSLEGHRRSVFEENDNRGFIVTSLTGPGKTSCGCYRPRELSSFHKINTLTFGDYFPGIVNPLDRNLTFPESPVESRHTHTYCYLSIFHQGCTHISLDTQFNQIRSATIQSMRILLRSLSNEGSATAIAEDETSGRYTNVYKSNFGVKT